MKESSIDEAVQIGKDGSKLTDRVSKLEAHNHYQDNEIDILKNIVEKERKVGQQLRDRVDRLEASNDNPKIIERYKRPYRLPTSSTKTQVNIFAAMNTFQHNHNYFK